MPRSWLPKKDQLDEFPLMMEEPEETINQAEPVEKKEEPVEKKEEPVEKKEEPVETKDRTLRQIYADIQRLIDESTILDPLIYGNTQLHIRKLRPPTYLFSCEPCESRLRTQPPPQRHPEGIATKRRVLS
jgi:hypothetical protein